MFLVDPKNVDKVLHICKQWDVTAVVVGKVIPDKITRVFFKGEKILEMDMDFFTGGPEYDTCQRPYTVPKQIKSKDKDFKKPDDLIISKKLLKWINNSPFMAVVITGGEPFLPAYENNLKKLMNI